MSSPDVILAGAGIIGLSTALELAGSGLNVLVLERERAMSEASWAAAGMLAAHDPENPAALQPVSNLSIDLYAEYLDAVEHLSGLCVPLRTNHALQGSEKGRNFAAGDILSAEEIAGRVPALNIEGRSFLWLDEYSLDPRDLCAALPRAAIAAGVTLVEQAPVTAVRSTTHGVTVTTPQGEYSARHFINCCGAWAGTVSPLPAVEPRKGQMITVMLPQDTQLPYVIRTPELYLVPRGDGRVVIGATVERTGFDKSVQETTIQTLLEDAAEMWPPIRNAQMMESWAGLRPGSADGLPVLGPLGEEYCWVATGHFRNGILLAPATARLMRQLVLGEEPAVDLSPFRCDRFAVPSI